MINVKGLTKSYIGENVLENITINVNTGTRVAIIGHNGGGKSTLLKCIAGYERYEAGTITILGNKKIGFLHQDFLEDTDETIWDHLVKEFTEIHKMYNEIQRVCEKMATDYSEKTMNLYAKLSEDYEKIGGYIFESKIKGILTQFGFHEEDFNKSIRVLSGGQKFKVAFAKLLAKEYEVLLLDEPTNHLDITTIEWLENYLKNYKGTIVFVSHDRQFIDAIATHIIEIENHYAVEYTGNYTQHLKEKELFIERNQKLYKKQQKQVQELTDLIDRFRYKATKRGLVNDRIKKLEKLNTVTKYKATTKNIKMNIQGGAVRSNLLTILEGSFGYDRPLITDVNFEVYAGEKIAIIGANGIGKSTIIKTILDQIPLLDGIMEKANKLSVGYMDQYLTLLDPDLTLLDYVGQIEGSGNLQKVRDLLGKYYFRSDDVFRKVKTLSGGEKVRLLILTLEMRPIDLLILDEPSNHLDIPTKVIFEQALNNYEGSIICVSHDRYFLEQFIDEFYLVEDGKLLKLEEN